MDVASDVASDTAPRDRRLRRLELSAITGVMVRDVTNYLSYWRSTTFS